MDNVEQQVIPEGIVPQDQPVVHEDMSTVDPTKKLDPMEVSSMGFGLYFPVFMNMFKSLSHKSMVRVVGAIFGDVLENKKVNKNNEHEVKTYKIGKKLMEDLMVLSLGTQLEAMEKARLNKEAANKVVEQSVEVKNANK